MTAKPGPAPDPVAWRYRWPNRDESWRLCRTQPSVTWNPNESDPEFEEEPLYNWPLIATEGVVPDADAGAKSDAGEGS